MTDQAADLGTPPKPTEGLGHYLAEMWRFRHFCLHLVGADIRSRFRRSYLGIVWAVLHPLFFALILGFVLSRLFNQTFADYSIYVLAGIMVWELVSSSLGFGAMTFMVAESYLKQNAIPAALFPVRTALGLFFVHIVGVLGLVLFAIAFKQDAITVTWLYYPVFLIIVLLFMIPLCIISGFLSLIFRDYSQAVGIILQIIVYLSPVYLAREVYASPHLAPIAAFNPVTQLCDLFRGLALQGAAPTSHELIVLAGWIVGLWIIALLMLFRYERKLTFML